MIKTEPILVCDHCQGPINIGDNIVFTYYGIFGGFNKGFTEDVFDAYFDESDGPRLEYHYHKTCYHREKRVHSDTIL